uniref:Ig-like domain-containing protein n=1 Tax=Periophthalmus magnuspinnatus TaxID=409849 RepID=A0A3B3ZEB5_9GOBI
MREEGDYTCYADNQIGRDEMKIYVKVKSALSPPQIQNRTVTSLVQVLYGENVTLQCHAKGEPTPTYTWISPMNRIIDSNKEKYQVFNNGTLIVRRVQRFDAGDYTCMLACIARNEGGEVRLGVNLEVKEANARMQVPETQLDDVSLTAGNAMTLNCSFEGHNIKVITWVLPNGTPLLSGARITKFFHRQDGSLVISNPTLAEAGTYRCLGRSNSGQVEQFVQLTLRRTPEIANRYNSPVNVLNGDRLMLHCVTNEEPLQLTWTLPSGVVLNRPQKAGRYSVLQNGTLAIQQVSVYDRGLYVCRAANEYGSSAISVSVIVIAYPPRITNGPNSVTYAKRGVAIQLNCAATVVSTQPRLFGNKYLHPQGSLVIQNPTPKDAGVYKCTARNAIGMDSKTTYLNVY